LSSFLRPLTALKSYLHFTSNNTIKGTQWSRFPDVKDVPLVCDMSSDFMWRPFDITKFGLVYAGVKYGANVNRLTKNTHRDHVGTPIHRYVPCRVEALPA